MKSYRQYRSSLRESYLRIQERGSTYGVTLNWRGRPLYTQIFFPDVFTRPSRTSVLQAVRKLYPNAKLIAYNPTIRDPSKPLLVSGEN